MCIIDPFILRFNFNFPIKIDFLAKRAYTFGSGVNFEIKLRHLSYGEKKQLILDQT